MLPRLSQRWRPLFPLCVLALLSACGTGGDPVAPPDTHSRTAVNGGDLVGTWRAMDSGTTELLWGVSGSTENDVIAVGTRGTAIHLAAETWEGKATGTGRDLCDVWGAPDGRAISVGTGGTALGYSTLQWNSMTSGTELGLFDTWGFENFEAVAVGDAGTILHLDGTDWSPMTSGTSVNLFGVWGSSPGDLFAVGVGGTIVHYDGGEWGFMDTPTPQNLSAVWGTAGGNVWAVGDEGTILHYDGAAWTSVTSGVPNNLYDVWGSGADDIWIVGQGGTILHSSGGAWAPVESGTAEDLFGVWGRSADEAYAVGANGTVLRFGPDVDANLTVWLCHDHPDGSVAPPLYGLRIDDLLGDGTCTFSFDYSDETEHARVILAYDESAGSIRISGRAYGGRVENDAWSASSSGWIDIDFTYATHLAVKDDCGALAGDDFYITGEDVANHGTIALDGWGGNLVFECTDRSGEGGACSFLFDNDYDPKGNAAIADDLSIWSASGWLEPHVGGSRDWLFIAEKITVPAE
jgi:hypothetical protein